MISRSLRRFQSSFPRAFPPADSSPSTPLFDACFVLNLDHRTDKWQHTQRQCRNARLERLVAPPRAATGAADGGSDSKRSSSSSSSVIQRVPGVVGTALDIRQLEQQGVVSALGAQRFRLPAEHKLFGMDLTPGALGCALGHRAIWQRILDQQLQRALILEDDAEFAPGFYRHARQRLSAVPADFDLVYLGGLDLLSAGKPPRPFVADGVRYAYEGHRELTAYVLHAEAAQRCLDMSTPMTWQIDTHITHQLTEDPRAPLSSADNGGHHDDNDDNGEATIHSNNNNRRYDRYISNPLSYVLQPALAIQVTTMGTDVQKKAADEPALEDASRRMREFVGGGTSVR